MSKRQLELFVKTLNGIIEPPLRIMSMRYFQKARGLYYFDIHIYNIQYISYLYVHIDLSYFLSFINPKQLVNSVGKLFG